MSTRQIGPVDYLTMLPAWYSDAHACCRAQQAYSRAGRWRDAQYLPARAAAAGVEPDEQLYSGIINAMGDNGVWREAVDIVQLMRGVGSGVRESGEEGGTVATSSGVTAVGAGPRAAAAEPGATVDRGLEGSPPLPRPGQAAYLSACLACAKQGQWEGVLGLMDDMREDGLERTASIYACAMRAFVEAGKWERAVQLVRDEVRFFFSIRVRMFYNERLSKAVCPSGRG